MCTRLSKKLQPPLPPTSLAHDAGDQNSERVFQPFEETEYNLSGYGMTYSVYKGKKLHVPRYFGPPCGASDDGGFGVERWHGARDGGLWVDEDGGQKYCQLPSTASLMASTYCAGTQ